MLALKNVKKSFNRQVILDIPELTLQPGIYWIKGTNGSGKSTLLKMIAGLLPFEGDILINGTSQQKDPLSYRHHLGWSEAEPLYPPFMRGIDLVRLYQRIRNASDQEIQTLIKQFNTSAFINGAVGSYSAGMTKRLSLLLAFIKLPPLIILDEPLTTLDSDSFSFVSDNILSAHEKLGITFLLSSHQHLDTRLSGTQQELTIINQTIVR